MYAQYSMTRFFNEISLILSDPLHDYWTIDEIRSAVTEGLREWSAITSYWRERGIFTINRPTPGSPTYFYDLSAVLSSLRPRTVTIDSIVREIQAHLLEPVSGIAGTGMSGQFSISAIVQAVVRARNRFVLDTQLPITVAEDLPVGPAPSGRITLGQQVIYLHRVAWKDAGGVYHPLYRSDEYSMDSRNPVWPLSPEVPPTAFSQAVTRPLMVQIYPPPSASGDVELLTVESVDTQASAVTTSTTLQIPDDFSPAIKYAALAELLALDSEAADPFRAQYCLFRYQSFVKTALAHKSVLRVQVNEKPVGLVPLFSMDTTRPYWHNQFGTPTIAGESSEVLAFSPSPDKLYGVGCDVARSAVLPTDDAGPIQIGPEEAHNIIDYCIHYLSFKLGGPEFRQTFENRDNFERQAMQRNAILANQAIYLTGLFGQGKWDRAKNPDLVRNTDLGAVER